MKAKTSLSLSEDLISHLDRIAGAKISRSAFVEQILRDFVERRSVQRRAARETAMVNRHAAVLNGEMSDVLSFQVTSAEQ